MRDLTDLTSQCIRCGFCLESCPTFVLTGEETESPRGRIYIVRSAAEGTLEWDDVQTHIDRCLGCLACVTACPSGVQYGSIFEIARDEIESRHHRWTKSMLLKGLTSRGTAKLQIAAGHLTPGRRIPGLLSKMLSGEPPQADKPRPQLPLLSQLDEGNLPAVKGEVFLLRGCVMDVLFQRVHECTVRLLRRIGYRVKEVDGGCCGSLELHAGYMNRANGKARSILKAFAGSEPIIVNSAGCGSTMKHYPQVVDSANAKDFSERVFDATEFLLANGLLEELRKTQGLTVRATYHDACHLAHGQGVRLQPRELLAAIPGIDLQPLSESDMCCGSAGIYNLTQPAMARALLERKWANIEATGAQVVTMGNPGCHAWIAQAAREHGGSVAVLHTMELLEAAFEGLEAFRS